MTTPRRLPHLVDVETLLRLQDEARVRVVDVRWRLGDPAAGPAAFQQGHIPGAVFVDVDRDLAGPPGEGGRHPLPTAAAFEAVMGRLGIDDDTLVVAYDDQGGATAARLWFLLRYFGHETGAVLDGGLDAFVAARLTLVDGHAVHPPTVFHAQPRPELIVDRATVASRLHDSQHLSLDARAAERYRGDVEPIDPRAGHIPGAINAPFAGNLDGGRFLAREAIQARYAALGADRTPTTVYCGSGVTACHDLLALALAGFPDATLYAGSWSEWARDPRAPVAR